MWRARCSPCARHKRAGSRTRGEAGDTLIEVLIALAVIGLTAVSLLGGFTTSISASAEHRNLAAEDTVLKAFIESVTYQLAEQSSSSPTFDTQCQGMTTYASLARTEQFGGITYSLTVTDPTFPIEYWVAGAGFTTSGCSAYASPFPTPPQQQLLTAEISGNGVPTQTLSFAISDPTFAPGSAASPIFESASNDTIVGNSSTSTFAVSASAYPTPALTLTSSPTPPSWVNFVDNGGGSGTLFMNPTAANASTTPYTITIDATNSLGTTPQTFSITVSSAPSFTSAPTYTAQPATAFNIPVTATGIPLPTISAVASTLPTGVSFTGGASGSGTLVGTSSVPPGVYTIDLQASSTGGSTSQVFTLTVDSATAPAFTSSATDTVPYGVSFSFPISTSGAPAPTITCSAPCTLPTGVSFAAPSAGSATISGTPTDPTPTQIVKYMVTLTASNGVNPAATQQFVLTVNPQSSPKITSTTPSPATGTKNNNFSFQVNGSGFIFTTGITVTFSSSKVTGTVNWVNQSTLTIACSPGAKGSFSFTITNPDGGSASSGSGAVVIS